MQLLVDYIGSLEVTPAQINESINRNDGKLIVSGIAQRSDSFNQNNRRYPFEVLKRTSDKYKRTFIAERRAMGELDHPDSEVVNLANVSHNMLDLWWEGNNLMCKLEILPTPSGNIAKELLKAGIRVGLSSRGMGSVRNLGEGKVEVEDDFDIVCWDLVSNPSTQGAFMNPTLNESVKANKVQKYHTINNLIGDIISIM